MNLQIHWLILGASCRTILESMKRASEDGTRRMVCFRLRGVTRQRLLELGHITGLARTRIVEDAIERHFGFSMAKYS